MTDRRSLQADAARTSRAFQFIPGHVGGRVASAQPVRRRRTIGGILATEAIPPTSVASTSASSSHGSLVTMSLPVGVLVGDELVVGFATTTTPPAMPDGWRELAAGAYSSLQYAIWHSPYSPELARQVSTTVGWGYRVWAFRGQRNGSWHLDGPYNMSSSQASPNARFVDSGPGFRWQIMFGQGLYAGWLTPPPGWSSPTSTIYGRTFCADAAQPSAWIDPTNGFVALEQAEGDYTHKSIGTYGTPTTSTWSIRYS